MKVAYLSPTNTIHKIDAKCANVKQKLTKDEARQMVSIYKFKLCDGCRAEEILETAPKSESAQT